MNQPRDKHYAVANVVRLCNELQRRGKLITGVSRAIVLDTTERQQLFDRIGAYVKTYNELKQFLQQHYAHSRNLGPRIDALPSIPVRSRGMFRPEAIASGTGGWTLMLLLGLLMWPMLLLFGIVAFVLGPLGVLYFVFVVSYLKRMQRKIHRISALLGSIAFILTAEDRNAIESAA